MQRVDPYGLVGQVLDGQFRVDAPIGEGGCSVVYKGHHIGLDAPVAIKCLKLQAQLGTAFVQTFEQRFRDESKIQYRLSQGSLNIVRTLGAGTTITPGTNALIPYMVLEWLDGFTLAEQLRARQARGEQGRSLTEILQLLDPVAEAMAFAHSLGVVHRDLNPSNLFVLVLPDGTQRLKVVDFGVAKVLSDNALQLAKRAATLGPLKMFTPAYGAPEQFSESFGAISPATDVYAFALLIVELLLDRPPIEGDSLATFLHRATDPNHRPTPWTLGCTTVGEHIEIALARALNVDPTRRPADIGAFWGALKNAANQDEDLRKRRSSRPPAAPPAGPRTKRGTLILPSEASLFPDSASSSSLFADSSTSSRPSFSDSPTNTGPRGTLQFQAPPSIEKPSTIRPPNYSAPVDPTAPTHAEAPRRGASPLSITIQPGEELPAPEAQSFVAPWIQASNTSSSIPPPVIAAAIQPSHTPSERPLAPEPAISPPSFPRWLLALLILTGLMALGFVLWFVFHMLAS